MNSPYVFLAFLMLCFAAEERKHLWDSRLPPRLQWLQNDGYCGEVSLTMALMRLGGGYISQYDARAIAAITPGEIQTSKFYLVGVNDQRAAKLLKLNFEEFDNSGSVDPRRYLSWVKAMVRRGHAVTITVFMNYYMFYGKRQGGEADYDHIVSVSSISSDYDDDLYHDDDVLTLEDHGLWAPRSKPVYLFSYTFGEFIATRAKANAASNLNVYSLPDSPDNGNFGVAHISIVDTDGEALPILVETSANYEDPHIKNGSEKRPAPMDLVLTVTVSGLEAGATYKLYKYNDENRVPTSAFNTNSLGGAAISTRDISSSSGSYLFTEAIKSNEKVFYRCVRSDAK